MKRKYVAFFYFVTFLVWMWGWYFFTSKDRAPEPTATQTPMYEWSGTLYQVTETLPVVETLAPATPTAHVALTWIPTATCDGVKIVAEGSSSITCSEADEKSLVIATIETSAGAITLNWGDQVYFIPGMSEDMARELGCDYNAQNKRPVGMDGYFEQVLPSGITPVISCTGLIITITATP